ncbi:GDYXXLXY domain-containing protein [Terricaulis sp.]|uniref:GDYXXLXY domain-containing protein n=1 Tax=Terricaulis sp. TaxID=2768686 RepID=UPI003783C0EB
MKLEPAPRILIVAGLCVLGLITLVVNEGMARAAGVEVRLPMAAYDPRSLLSGDYVTLAIQQPVPVGEQCPAQDPTWDWLALAQRGDHHVFAGSAPSLETARQIAPIAVKGTFTCNPPWQGDDVNAAQPGVIVMNVGISRFHINHAEAQRIEQILRDQRPGEEAVVYAIVSVGRDGRARLKGLLVDGERLELNWD